MNNYTKKETYIEPSADVWNKIIKKAAESKKVFIYILLSLKNKQHVSVFDIASYEGIESKNKKHIIQKANLRIGNISRWMNKVLGTNNGTFYFWNHNNLEWHIGHNSHANLQTAYSTIRK